MNVRLRRPLDVISGRPQDVRLGRPRDVRSGRRRDGQIGSLWDVLETLDGDVLGTSWGPIFAGWEMFQIFVAKGDADQFFCEIIVYEQYNFH